MLSLGEEEGRVLTPTTVTRLTYMLKNILYDAALESFSRNADCYSSLRFLPVIVEISPAKTSSNTSHREENR